MLSLKQIHPAPGRDVSAADAYARPDGVARHVCVNMVSSVDGAATIEGRVGALTGPADQELLGILRSLSDVLLVGAATVRAEGYGPVVTMPELAERRRTAGQEPAPRLAMLTRALDLDLASRAFTAAVARPVLITTERAAPERLAAARAVADVVIAGEESVDLRTALDVLADRGLPRILSEGGPRVLAQLFSDDLVDELCLAISPVVVSGAGQRIMSGPALPQPVPMRLAAAFEEDGFLFTRYLRSPRE
ncbi:MAG: pyrimidine reductase family protein [Intrasporangium sp.]|uniref:pyrimidine reductase family protein n=1 Tax=Intrasporangium sp. TaxID=1925024 RepID=UPI00264A3866|nr:pyrimidine reductase family protein [Intrasporangium sp.]MDN5796503.1 pyrimidine reductase family protein [Intrasporangium sp.]